MDDCYRCQEIIAWLHGREKGRTVRCPICGKMYRKGINFVLDEDFRPMVDMWKRGDRPAHCISCDWHGPISSVKLNRNGSFPFRCPECGSIVADHK
ncbi:MAG: hypothetical protein SA339_13900 [Methanomassiliicoccus sp.]|nr:hypothetical protein [Methanomassiliicoccus sp.]